MSTHTNKNKIKFKPINRWVLWVNSYLLRRVCRRNDKNNVKFSSFTSLYICNAVRLLIKNINLVTIKINTINVITTNNMYISRWKGTLSLFMLERLLSSNFLPKGCVHTKVNIRADALFPSSYSAVEIFKK